MIVAPLNVGMKNVCIVSPFCVLPPITGARRRVFEIARALCEVGISATVLHPGRSESMKSGVKFVGFAGFQSLSITRDLPGPTALETYLSSASPVLYQKLATILRNQRVDILQIESPWSIFPCLVALALAPHRIPLVYDAHNVESISIAQSSSVPWMAPYATFVERKAAEHSDSVLCVSEVDRRRMCELHHLQSKKVKVIPNGVSISEYRKDSAAQIKLRHSLDKDSRIILFHGALGWRPNAEAAQQIVDSIAPEMDDSRVVFLIAGPQAPRKLLKRAEHRHNVRILGAVDDITDYVCSADVCIAPMKTGSGTKLKILEYLAARKPVVATRKAVEGIGIQGGKQALLTDTTGNEFIALIKAAMTVETSELLASNAEIFVRQFDWSLIANNILHIYETIAA